MMRAETVIADADVLLTCDAEHAVRHRAWVAIADGRISAVAEGDRAQAWVADRVIDARGRLVMPGLVNLHTHLPMTLLRGIAEDVDLQGFLERVFAEEARVMDEVGTELGATLGAVEALLGGTTTALDMYLHPHAAHRGAVTAGLRHVTGPVFFSFPGPDNLTWPERMAYARTWPERLRQIGGPVVPVALMPHCPLTVGPSGLAEIATLAREQGALVHTHLSETRVENADTVSSFGHRPTALMQASGLLEMGPILAHGVHLEADEQDAIARAGAAVAHCPGSNLKLASGAADIVAYRRRGIAVGIGTDGCSSSNDLDMFAAMRLAANLARLVRDDPAAISAVDIVRAATIDGATALGMAERIGSVEVGKEADLILLDLAAAHLSPLRDPNTAIVFAAGRSDVEQVLVAGEPVVAGRRALRVDLTELLSRVNAATAPGAGPA